MFYQIFGLLFAISFSSAADSNDTDVTGRFYGSFNGFPSYQQNRCLSRNRRPGKCVSLQICPELLELSNKYNPMYVLQAVSDYACGFNQRAVQVCCPDERNGVLQPLVDPSRPTNNGNNAPGQFPGNSNSRPYPNYERPTNNNFNWPNSNNNGNNNFNKPNNNASPPSGITFNGNKPNNGGNRKPPQGIPDITNSNVNNNGPVPFPLVESTTETSTVPTVSNTEPQLTTVHRNRRLLPETTCGLSVQGKIIGGTETSLEDYPWMALLRLRYANGRTGFSCGGSLIAPRYVLTAAHCIKNPDIPLSALIDQVRLGEYDQDSEVDCTKDRQCSPPPENIDIEERIVHSKYNMNDNSQQNDIALLRLKRPVKYSSYILPICLPLDSIKNINYDGERLWTAGWGKTTNNRNSRSPVKLKVDLPIIPYSECSSNYKAKNLFITERQICAGGEANKDSCSGDSGGPLMSQDLVGKQFRWHVQGIVSIGPKQCGTAGSPGIYTKVSDYMDWILDNMRE